MAPRGPSRCRSGKSRFFDHAPFAAAGGPRPVLASAFFVENIPYRWRRGVREALPESSSVVRLPPRRPLQGVSNIVRFNWPF